MLRNASLSYRRNDRWGELATRPSTGMARLWFLEIPLREPSRGVTCPRDELLAKFEAILFLSQHPLSSRKVAQLTGLADGTKARTLIRSLNRIYDAEGRSFRVEEVAGGYQLMTRPKFAPWLRRLHSAPVEIRLSGPAMETLAVVAYRQPVLRAEIEAIRGVQSGEVLRQLIERNLVRLAGRSDELGRPFLYGTTKQFLQTFGLKHLDELPRSNVLRADGAAVVTDRDHSTRTETDNQNHPNQSPVAEEETNVKTLITAKAKQAFLAEDRIATVMERPFSDRSGNATTVARYEDDDVDEDDDDDDAKDDEDDEDDLDDEPWEEVDDEDADADDDEEEDDDEWDDDEDWDDEDWDDEDDDEEDDEWDDDDDDEEEDEDKDVDPD